MAGCFIGIGVGPGDPKLLTVRAVECIQEADVIIAPRSEKKEDSRALFIAQSYIKAETQIIKMVFPMVNSSEVQQEAWKENRKVLRELMEQGKKVVFLTLGDPMFYSTYMYVFQELKEAGYEVENVPGIPAFCGISNFLGYPVAEGTSVLTIIPATMDEAELDKTLATADNVVLMKAYKNVASLIGKLRTAGFSGVLVSNYGLPDQKVSEWEEVERVGAPYLSTILARRA